MFYSKTGLPEEGDIVMCTVTKIQYSSVFVNIDDYNKSGMIHISEIAAGRIRNIRDYVKEDKKIICKVLRVNEERGHVDLSLRRVTDGQRRKKVNEIKLEQKAESILEYVAKQNNIPVRRLYDELASQILEEYVYVHQAFEDVMDDNFDLSELKADKKVISQIKELVLQRFKPKIIEVSGVLKLSSYESNGIDIIKTALEDAEKTPGVVITYLGGGKFKVSAKDRDYKVAEPNMLKAVETAITYVKNNKGSGEFKKNEK